MKYLITFMAYCFSNSDLSTFGRRAFCMLENPEKQNSQTKFLGSLTFLIHKFTHENVRIIRRNFFALVFHKTLLTFIKLRNKYSRIDRIFLSRNAPQCHPSYKSLILFFEPIHYLSSTLRNKYSINLHYL